MSGHLTKDELAAWVGDRRTCDRPGSEPVQIGQVLADALNQIRPTPTAATTDNKPQKSKQ